MPSANRTKHNSQATVVSLTSLSTASVHRRSTSISSFVCATNGHERSKTADLRPRTPPPFTSRATFEPLLTVAATPAAFSARRRRAAKLAHFFGVGYHDLSQSVLPTTTSSPSSANELSDLDARFPASRTPPTSVQVDVKMSSPTRFWGFMDGRHNVAQDVNMDEVIGRLREMKAK